MPCAMRLEPVNKRKCLFLLLYGPTGKRAQRAKPSIALRLNKENTGGPAVN
jgi:hypothetical protein